MELIGFIASVFIGITLGLIGGGGSILTVPVLVYLFNIDAVAATAYSLFIVGISSVVGSITYFKRGLINIKTAIIFSIPSILTVYLTRAYIVSAIPKNIFYINTFVITKNILMMLVFAILMIAASFSMIKKNKINGTKIKDVQTFNYPLIVLEGSIVGMLTGLVGAGGGFLIMPALVLLSKLPIKEAVGTSLVIIAAKSLIGFVGESGDTIMDWNLILKISALAILGIFIGTLLSKKIDGEKLKPFFGWFVLTIGIYIIIKEIIFR